jgi:hypothetical protein
MEITTAGRAHDGHCSKKHRLEKGMRRLTIKEGSEEQHYCLSCARVFLGDGLDRLERLLAEVNGLTGR